MLLIQQIHGEIDGWIDRLENIKQIERGYMVYTKTHLLCVYLIQYTPGQHIMAQPDHSVLRTPVFELDNMATQLPSLTESLLFVETESKHSVPI